MAGVDARAVVPTLTPVQIEADRLTKIYGAHTALDDVSFSVAAGEIVGLLGTNGAGKTTTMRLLTGSLGATAGSARIGGLDVAEKPKEIKRMVGYLPEVPPLYTDMTVRDYLRFVARLRSLAEHRAAVERVIERTGLHEVAGRVIAHLSKGFRQRVGIAQAIVHDPRVLVLDEPLSGLDPAQRRDIRELVQELSQGDTTVILSTHVLTEVEAMCDRVLVIHRGRLVGENAMADIASLAGAVRLVVARPEPALAGLLSAIDGVSEVELFDEGRVTVHTTADVREEVARVAVAFGLRELRAEQALEEAFLRLTGGAA